MCFDTFDVRLDGVRPPVLMEVFHVADDLWDHLFFRSGGRATRELGRAWEVSGNGCTASVSFPMGNREIFRFCQVELPSHTQSGYVTTALNDFKRCTIGPAVGLIADFL